MAYRMLLVMTLTGLVACGNDSSQTTTQMDAPPGVDPDAMMADSDGATSDGPPGMSGDAGVGAVCGGATCMTGEECCLGNGGSTCVAEGQCSGVAFGCDGPEDCSGNEVCCYGNQGGGGAGMGGSECKPTNQCQLNACHDDTDCSGQTSKCCSVQASQYKVCLAQCPP